MRVQIVSSLECCEVVVMATAGKLDCPLQACTAATATAAASVILLGVALAKSCRTKSAHQLLRVLGWEWGR